MTCLFCNSNKISNSYFPNTKFNGKEFSYKLCKECKLIFVDPIPDNDDLIAMYPTSYQEKVDDAIVDSTKKLAGLRFSYSQHFELIRNNISKEQVICDFGCGTGNFIFNALHHGIKMDGVEFNPDFVTQLSATGGNLNFYTVDDFFCNEKKYDLIRLSNVFEHFTNPVEMMKTIGDKLNPGGCILIEGPLENNTSFALFYKRMYFRLKKKLSSKSVSTHAPTHIVYTNKDNQMKVFRSLGYESIEYKITEFPWPFPEHFAQVKSLKLFVMFVFGKFSVLASSIVPGWGNTFLYLGKKENKS